MQKKRYDLGHTVFFHALRNCSTRPRRFAVSVKEKSLDRRAISGGRCPLFYTIYHA